MSKNPDKRWERCLYCDASIKGDDAHDAQLHDPYCPHGKSLVKLTAALADARASLAHSLSQAEVDKALDAKLLDNVTLHWKQKLAAIESHQRWVAVSERQPPIEVRVMAFDPARDLDCQVLVDYLIEHPERPGRVFFVESDPTHWMPLPAAPLGDLPARSEGA